MPFDDEHQYCVDNGAGCVNLVVELPDGKRRVGVCHYRVVLRVEWYDGTVRTSDAGDEALVAATGYASLASFTVNAEAAAKLPILEP